MADFTYMLMYCQGQREREGRKVLSWIFFFPLWVSSWPDLTSTAVFLNSSFLSDVLRTIVLQGKLYFQIILPLFHIFVLHLLNRQIRYFINNHCSIIIESIFDH